MNTGNDHNTTSLAKYQDTISGDSGYGSTSFGSTCLSEGTTDDIERRFQELNLEKDDSKKLEYREKIAAYIKKALTPDEDNDTYLNILMAKGWLVEAQQLIEICPKACYLDIQNNLGQAGIHVASYLNLYHIVHQLILKGVKIDLVDIGGKNLFHICAERGHIETLGAIVDAVKRTGQVQTMMQLLHEPDNNGYTPFYTAVSHKKSKICSFLASSFNINVNTMDQKSGNSPLHEAVIPLEADPEFVQFLIKDCKLNVNHQNYIGITPLHIASSKNDKPMCSVLLYHNADVNMRDIQGLRPVDYTNDSDIREYLQP